jgi:hypothetical protein
LLPVQMERWTGKLMKELQLCRHSSILHCPVQALFGYFDIPTCSFTNDAACRTNGTKKARKGMLCWSRASFSSTSSQMRIMPTPNSTKSPRKFVARCGIILAAFSWARYARELQQTRRGRLLPSMGDVHEDVMRSNNRQMCYESIQQCMEICYCAGGRRRGN